MTGQEGPWFGMQAAADYLDMSTRRLYDLTQHGDISAKQDGRRPKYSRQELDRYASALPDVEPRSA
jgi:excisionase family DNA binding protein